jgi:hypothetical protein
MTNEERIRKRPLAVRSFVIGHSSFIRAMLPTSLVQEIDRMLKEGELSHRQIALRLNVSRGTISAIACGRRGLHGKDPVENRRFRTPTSAPKRCPCCGYRVYLPCLICRTRMVRESRRQASATDLGSNHADTATRGRSP